MLETQLIMRNLNTTTVNNFGGLLIAVNAVFEHKADTACIPSPHLHVQARPHSIISIHTSDPTTPYPYEYFFKNPQT